MMKYPASQRRATKKYNDANYEEIRIRVRKGEKEKIKSFAKANGESLNGFISRAIIMAMDQDLGNDMDGCHGEDNTPGTE